MNYKGLSEPLFLRMAIKYWMPSVLAPKTHLSPAVHQVWEGGGGVRARINDSRKWLIAWVLRRDIELDLPSSILGPA